MELRNQGRELYIQYGYTRGSGSTISCFERVAEESFKSSEHGRGPYHRRSLRPKWQPWKIISDRPFVGDWESTCCPRSEQCERDCPGLRFRIYREWIQTDSRYRYTMVVEMDERLICCAGAYQRWVDKGYEVRITDSEHPWCKSFGNVQPKTEHVKTSARQVALDYFVGARERL